MRLLGAVLRLIQGRCCLGVGLTLSFYSLSPLMRKHLKGSGKCDFDKKPHTAVHAKTLTGRTINPSVVQVRHVLSSMTGRGTRGPPKPLRGTIQLPITHGGGWVEEVCEQLDYGCEDVEGGEGYCAGVRCGDSC